MTKKEIVVKTQADIAVTERLGFEEQTDRSDLIIPSVKLFQGTPTEQEQYPDAKMGQILNSLTQEVLPEIFVPVFKWTEVIKFNKRKPSDEGFDPAYEPGALIWKCTDPNDARCAESEWGPNGEKPRADKVMSFLCYFENVQMPLVLRFFRTSYKAGKKLISLAQFSGGNMFDRQYKIGTKKEQSDGNTYHVLTVDPKGLSSEASRKLCIQWYNDLRGKSIKVHEEEQKATPDFEE